MRKRQPQYLKDRRFTGNCLWWASDSKITTHREEHTGSKQSTLQLLIYWNNRISKIDSPYNLSLPRLMIADKLVRAKPDKIIIEMANLIFNFVGFLYFCMSHISLLTFYITTDAVTRCVKS